MIKKRKIGKLFIITGPSGAGKDEILKCLVELGCSTIKVATTRKKRASGDIHDKTVYLEKNITKEKLLKQGFGISFTSYGNHYYINTNQIIEFIKNGENCVLITSKIRALNLLKQIKIIKKNVVHILVYRSPQSLNFYLKLEKGRNQRKPQKEDKKIALNRYEEAKYLLTRASEEIKFDYVIMNVKKLDFLKKQVVNLFNAEKQKSKKRFKFYKKPFIFFLNGTEETGKTDLFEMIEYKILNHDIKIVKQYTDDISADENIYIYDVEKVKKCDIVYTKRGWLYGINIKDIKKILKNKKDVLIDINDINKIEEIKNKFKNYRVKNGYLFSETDHDTKSGEIILNTYAENIEKIDFTMLNVLPLQDRLDALESLFYHNINKDTNKN